MFLQPGYKAAAFGIQVAPPQKAVIAHIKDISGALFDWDLLGRNHVIGARQVDREVHRCDCIGVVNDADFDAIRTAVIGRPTLGQIVERNARRIDEANGVFRRFAQAAMRLLDEYIEQVCKYRRWPFGVSIGKG